VDSTLAMSPEGLGSSPDSFDQQENLLKLRGMKKQDKIISNWSRGFIDRW